MIRPDDLGENGASSVSEMCIQNVINVGTLTLRGLFNKALFSASFNDRANLFFSLPICQLLTVIKNSDITLKETVLTICRKYNNITFFYSGNEVDEFLD